MSVISDVILNTMSEPPTVLVTPMTALTETAYTKGKQVMADAKVSSRSSSYKPKYPPVKRMIDGKEKRAKLRELILPLGPDSTGAEIRRVCYIAGFGDVSHWMLLTAKDELWPDRKRKSKGNGPRPEPNRLYADPVLAERLLVKCPSCGSRRTKSFGKYVRKDGSINQSRKCKDCDHRFATQRTDEESRTDVRRLLASIATHKECCTCREMLPVGNFGHVAGDAVKRRSSCKKCLNAKRSESQFNSVLIKHGLTIESYNEILTAQGGKCAICRAESVGNPRMRVWCVDHCHATGKVRGLLCSRCNLAIGNFNDDLALMSKAMQYIQFHGAEN